MAQADGTVRYAGTAPLVGIPTCLSQEASLRQSAFHEFRLVFQAADLRSSLSSRVDKVGVFFPVWGMYTVGHLIYGR